MKKIINIISDMKDKGEIWNYAIVHSQVPERADVYAEKLTRILDRQPAYIMDISPVVGVHNGIGAVGIAVMYQ